MESNSIKKYNCCRVQHYPRHGDDDDDDGRTQITIMGRLNNMKTPHIDNKGSASRQNKLSFFYFDTSIW